MESETEIDWMSNKLQAETGNISNSAILLYNITRYTFTEQQF